MQAPTETQLAQVDAELDAAEAGAELIADQVRTLALHLRRINSATSFPSRRRAHVQALQRHLSQEHAQRYEQLAMFEVGVPCIAQAILDELVNA